MAQKYYAIKLANGQTAIKTSWNEAKAMIDTCPSNAIYKRFSDPLEADAFLHGQEQEAEADPSVQPGVRLIAYVDGSFNELRGQWGYGAYLYDAADPEQNWTLSGSGEACAEMRNVTGELTATLNALQMAVAMGYEEVIVHHDYAGIAFWPNGDWKSNNKLTRHYDWAVNVLRNKLHIDFVKVAAHTGVLYNEKVDQLAKQACGMVVTNKKG